MAYYKFVRFSLLECSFKRPTKFPFLSVPAELGNFEAINVNVAFPKAANDAFRQCFVGYGRPGRK
jgi:hypothetical protein